MKKTNVMLILISAATLAFTSCKKSETLLKPTYTNELVANQTYVFTLPTNTNDAFEITTNPAHASINLLGQDANGANIYTYTPVLNYVGADQVVISTVEGRPPHPGRGPKCGTTTTSNNQTEPIAKGGCNKAGDDLENDYVITINFVIKPELLNKLKDNQPNNVVLN